MQGWSKDRARTRQKDPEGMEAALGGTGAVTSSTRLDEETDLESNWWSEGVPWERVRGLHILRPK